MRLAELVQRLGGVLHPEGGAGREVTGVHLDSRSVGAGDLFAALPGTRDDGAKYANDALRRGAVAILTHERVDVDRSATQWIHADARRVAGQVAALVHGEPARRMFTAAITGTNGKTTTAHLLGHLLTRAGKRPAVLGTAGNRLADGVLLHASHTTPDAPELQRLLVRHAEMGGDALAMEVSSHALDQERTAGIDFDVAVFTNLTRDHLDYHGDFDAYARAKERLFSGLQRTSTAILNADDSASSRMADAARRAGARVVTYSARTSGDLCASHVRTDLRGTQLFLNGMGISRTLVWLPLAGRYNVENALAAAAAALVSGASPSSILEGLATAPSAPGRLEPVPTNGRGFTLLVDYAHSEAALANVCSVLRATLDSGTDEAVANESRAHARAALTMSAGGPTSATAIASEPATRRRLIVVFGCGGDRDKGKRAPMGRVVNELADLAIVTSDNPRSEDPDRILSEIVAGMEPARAERIVEVDRRSAIGIACSRARRGDVVLIAGKGHETTQTIGPLVFEFDDRRVAAEELR